MNQDDRMDIGRVGDEGTLPRGSHPGEDIQLEDRCWGSPVAVGDILVVDIVEGMLHEEDQSSTMQD